MLLTDALIQARHPHPIPAVIDRSEDRSEAELRSELDRMLTQRPDRQGVWVFAYGSLIWKPEDTVQIREQQIARVHGLHRRFCLWQWRSRGSPAQPCLMMALDRGGACKAVVQRLEGEGLVQQLWPIWQREMRGRGYVARWVDAATEQGVIKALTFVANRSGTRYAGDLDVHTQADYLASGCGPRGACAEYLRNTVVALEQLHIRDRYLWRLQKLVAKRLAIAT